MLLHLHIRNYALVERLELDLASGFTVLTGETGAGKSILIEALGLALGERADSAVIRSGAERAEVSAAFGLAGNDEAARWLAEHELDEGGECLLRRTVAPEGRSKAYINGSPVPLQDLRALGALLVDIHGQHEHQSLLQRERQLALLDAFAAHDDLLAEVRDCYRSWKDLNRRLDELLTAGAAGDGQLELLRYQAQELEALAVTAEELRALDEEHKRLANAERLLAATQVGLAGLDEEDAINTRLARINTELRECSQADPALAPVVELLTNAAIQLEEATTELRRYAERLELDPRRLSQIEQRLAEIHDQARKHRVRAQELPALREQLRARLAGIEGAEETLATLRREIAAAEGRYAAAAERLGTSRAAAARTLAERATQHLQALGMPHARFSIDLQARPEERPAPGGRERIELLVSANPQQPPRPLAKVASGGELSRISLAIQVVTAEQGTVPTLIFDEVDVGIGGRVAEIVGQGLRRLGERRQVLCITHLPQVAALGHHHLAVRKRLDAAHATVSIETLSREQRREEIARMLGGVRISAKTREHAEEMIESVRSEE